MSCEKKINKAEFCIKVVKIFLKGFFQHTYLGKNSGKLNLVSLISNTENILLKSSVRKTIAKAVSEIPELSNVPLLFGFFFP